MHLRPARPGDEAAIAALLGAAFGGGDEVRLVERLRSSGEAVVELVAEGEAGGLVGEVMLSRMVEPDGWLALAPVAAAPAWQGRGIGSALVRAAVSAARAGGWEAVVVVGDPGYYERFGFSVSAARGLSSPYPLDYTGLLVLRAKPPDAGAELAYPAAFAEL